MVFLFVASHSTDLVLPCKKDTLCFIENVSFSVPLKIKVFRGFLMPKIADTVCPDLKGFGVF